MTVSELRKKLKGVNGDLPVFVSDHDHGRYEWNGKVGDVLLLNQRDMDDFERKALDKNFAIIGNYISIRVG